MRPTLVQSEWFGIFMCAVRSAIKIRVWRREQRKMKSLKLFNSMLMLLIAGCLSACSNTPTKSPDVADNIRKSLDQANLKDVSVSQDRDKGVVTLTGTTGSDSNKAQAESIAKSRWFAGRFQRDRRSSSKRRQYGKKS